jgi:phosphoribosylglycinamide formyltransferase-1
MLDSLCLGILVSGRGSNLAAIIGQIEAGRLAARVGVVISDNPSAPALKIAAEKRLPKAVVERKAFPNKASFEIEIASILKAHQVDLVVLAGFMRLLSPLLVADFPDRIINVHPALLPAFPGLNAQKQALDHGVKITGCTVHFVNEIMDGGPIISQAAVPVLPNDTEESLSARILKEEHRLLPEAIGRLASILTPRR